jgi:hypothetical protein
MVYLSLETFNFNAEKSTVMQFISTIFTVSNFHGRDMEPFPKVLYPEQNKRGAASYRWILQRLHH